MDVLINVIEDESIDEIFESPENYVDDSYDRPIVEVWGDGETLFVVSVGIDDVGNVYISLEDDETCEDFYPNLNEDLWDVFARAIDDWLKDNQQ